jgi:hypothetical protein
MGPFVQTQAPPSIRDAITVDSSQLLEGLKCESQIENIERAKGRSTLGLQHFGGVKGRVGASGWD